MKALMEPLPSLRTCKQSGLAFRSCGASGLTFRPFCIQALPLMGEGSTWGGPVVMDVICSVDDVSKMANDMAKLAEVAEVSGALQVQEVWIV